MHAAAIDITMRHPHGAHMRRTHPMAVSPHPASVPYPRSAHPNIIGSRRNGDCFHNRSGRRLGYYDFLTDGFRDYARATLADYDALAPDAAGQEQ